MRRRLRDFVGKRRHCHFKVSEGIKGESKQSVL